MFILFGAYLGIAAVLYAIVLIFPSITLFGEMHALSILVFSAGVSMFIFIMSATAFFTKTTLFNVKKLSIIIRLSFLMSVITLITLLLKFHRLI
jgi:hypothetical protein